MATIFTFLSDATFGLTSSKSVTIECYGSGGGGSNSGNGSSGGAYSKVIKTLNSGSYLVEVGINNYDGHGNGGNTCFKSGSANVIICQAGGGEKDGTIANQLVSTTGSTVYYGGYGSPDFLGYASYNGGGGGGGAGTSANGENGQSAFYSTNITAATGGYSVGGGTGGSGGLYYAGSATNRIIVPKSGIFPGGGAGGSYDYGHSNESAGGNGVCYVTVP